MRAIIDNIFGVYTPIETLIANEFDGTTYSKVADGMAGIDWTWIAGVLLFAIMLYGLLRIVGVLFKQ